MNARETFEELTRAVQMIESTEFKKYIMKPIGEEMIKCKNAYDCKTLNELNTVKGKKIGLKIVLKLMKKIVAERENAHDDLDT